MDHTTNHIHNTAEATAIAEIVRKAIEPKLVTVTSDGKSVEVLIAATGTEVTSVKDLVDEYRTSPERVKGTAEVTTLESFIAHAKRFSDASSALFAHRDPATPHLLAVYDYHPPVDGDDDAAKNARFGQHRAKYTFPIADEWAAWTRASGSQMSQAAFAEFLEDRLADVSDPIDALKGAKDIMDKLLCTFAGPSRLLELARGLTVRVDSVVANKQDLKSGESTIRFETTHNDERGAPLEVPGAFLIAVPVFRGGATYQIAARLRYRIQGGKVLWHYDLYRTQETFDHAFGEACDRATAETELPLFFGKPEAG